MALAVKATLSGLVDALVVTARMPESVPFSATVTVMLQLASEANVDPQSFDSVNPVGATMLVIVRLDPPELSKVITCEVPTAAVPKAKGEGDRSTAGPGGVA
jgi:hypothetical protein